MEVNMWMKLVNWLRGYLCVRIRGTSPERFINLCRHHRIFIWDLMKIEEDYQFYITIKNFKKLRPIVRKTGMVPKITAKHGLPFYIYRNRKRKGFFIGVIICSILVYIMSLHIWDISVMGGSKYTPEALIKFLDNNDIYTGIKKRKVDCQWIEDIIRLEYNDIGWVSAEIRGTRLIIKITETNMPKPAGVTIAPSHIVASKDGIIQSIITRSGTPLVKKGDVVKKGDMLVSGIITVLDDFGTEISKKPVVADADIRVKSFYNYEDVFSMNYIEKQYTGEEKRGYQITLWNNKIFLRKPIYSYEKYDIIVNEKTLHLTNSFYLPFRYGTISVREYKELNKKYTEEEAIAKASMQLKRYFDRLAENDVLILENNVTITIEDNLCIAQGKIIVDEPAWEYKIIQESEWRIEQIDEHNGNNN